MPNDGRTPPTTHDHLIPPYGDGRLVDLVTDGDRAVGVQAASRDWPSWDLTPRQACDLELLATGGLSPLASFIGRADYDAVCDRMALADGTLWPMPITLDVPEKLADALEAGSRLALRDPEGVMLGFLEIEEMWRPDRRPELLALFGTDDVTSEPVRRYVARSHPVCLAGRLEVVQLPVHYDYRELRLTPSELRTKFGRLGWRRVLAFQTHQTMHRAQQATTQQAALDLGANLLIHPVVGLSPPGDADHYTRVRCYQALLPHYPKDMARLSLLPLAPRLAGPREAVWQAIVHRNHGCTHFMVQANHATTVLESSGAPAYDPEEARELVQRHAGQLGVTMVPYRELVYLDRERTFVALSDVPDSARVRRFSGDEVRRRLDAGLPLPEWYTVPEVERELRHRHPPRSRQGLTVFFTGLSGSGKSTVANALRVKLLELGGRGVTLLDGDLVRKNLSSELGFSKEHRDLNIRRIGFVAAEITRAGGVAICAPIAPYDAVRRDVREMVEACGGFVLVHVATPLDVCEARDRKGMYAKARAGVVKEFTGISDPYEVPADADVVLDTSDITPAEATREILLHLEREGYLSAG